jgi:hypothetical protein
VTFRGDTDFTQMGHLDRWDAAGVRFLFGSDARANVVRIADALPDTAWAPLTRPVRHTVRTTPRERPTDVKAAVIIDRAFKNLRLEAEAVAEFPYQPTVCAQPYRMVVLRKNISVEQGDQRLFDEIRYLFYLTNDRTSTPAAIVFLANDRCNQREPDRSTQARRPRHADASGHAGQQRCVHGDGRAGLGPEGVVCVVAAGAVRSCQG